MEEGGGRIFIILSTRVKKFLRLSCPIISALDLSTGGEMFRQPHIYLGWWGWSQIDFKLFRDHFSGY